ncbi:RP-L11e [Lepeophtheirus salmonis]|uniref:RP-L11e n=1 Tax=Lepeophtheirus salmonis TaxID=72036 RepID=A0A7R8H959_LEPSM|nr:RP-L11e [Lepeophtheirus salmonis]CAF2935679.1 RP-L11e [Lepeophtheirus salmonis]
MLHFSRDHHRIALNRKMSSKDKNPMHNEKIPKLCLNIWGRYIVRSLGIRLDERKITVDEAKAKEILKNGLKVWEYVLKRDNFSKNGNFGFVIMRTHRLVIMYDPSIGNHGIDFYIILGRTSMNVSRPDVSTKSRSSAPTEINLGSNQYPQRLRNTTMREMKISGARGLCKHSGTASADTRRANAVSQYERDRIKHTYGFQYKYGKSVDAADTAKMAVYVRMVFEVASTGEEF